MKPVKSAGFIRMWRWGKPRQAIIAATTGFNLTVESMTQHGFLRVTVFFEVSGSEQAVQAMKLWVCSL